MLNKFKSAKRAGVPIIAIETADPAATIQTLNCFGETAVMQWDIIRGLSAINELGLTVVNNLCGGDNPALVTGNPAEMLGKLTLVPNKTIIFMHQANRLLETSDPGMAIPIAQGIWNLRDIFKSRGAILVLLGSAFMLPPVLKNDVMVISEPLPDAETIKTIITAIAADAQASMSGEETVRFSKSLLGLSSFSAEQSFATSLFMDNDGVHVDEKGLWERKCKTAEQTRGIEIYRGTECFNDILGYGNVKEYLKCLMAGPDTFEVVVFIDEVEKQMAGFKSDSSGVSGEQMGGMLTWMQSREMLGILLLGHPGTGKSLVGLATGNEAKKPTVIFNLSTMKEGLVGRSMENLTVAQKVVDGMAGGGKILVIGTCNSFGSLPTELKRRFRLGTFFFDLPDKIELASIQDYYIRKFGLRDNQITQYDNDGWTGAEIKNCCDLAWRLNSSLAKAASYIVPISKSDGEGIGKLQNMAEGKFISASVSGFYRKTRTAEGTGRQLNWKEGK